MAKYRLTEPAFVHGVYHEADVRNPKIIELPDDVEPSTTWAPVDGAAKAALERMDKARLQRAEETRQAILNPVPVLPTMARPPKRELVKEEVTTVSAPSPPAPAQDTGPHFGGKSPKRASDKDAL